MALPSFSITCAYTGNSNYNQSTPPLLSNLVWQEAPSTGTASTAFAPGLAQEYGPPVFVAYATADSWLSYGASPNSNASPRVPVPANTLTYFIVQPGDKFMWQAA